MNWRCRWFGATTAGLPPRIPGLCPWKGQATYFSLLVDGELNPEAAWTYADPKPEAEMVRGRVAFWKGVTVT